MDIDKENQNKNTLAHLVGELQKGNNLEAVCKSVYSKLRLMMPLDRLGIALRSEDGSYFYSRINIYDQSTFLCEGYKTPSEKSSLTQILEKREARVINNLPAYLEKHPESSSTRLIVSEGIKSNLSLPLISRNQPLGVLFFSSRSQSAYNEGHLEIVKHIAGLLSIAVDRAILSEKMEENRMKFLATRAEKDGLVAQIEQSDESEFASSSEKTWEEWEQYILEHVLTKTKGRIYGARGAAKILNLPPTTLQGKIRKRNINPKSFKNKV